MTERKKNILFVANLQVYATPYASLYIDKEHNSLYMFVRVSSPLADNVQYAVTDVTSSLVYRYMKRQIGLDTLLSGDGCRRAYIRNNEVYFESGQCFTPDETLKKAAYFNPEYCEDSTKLKFFLKRFDKQLIN